MRLEELDRRPREGEEDTLWERVRGWVRDPSKYDPVPVSRALETPKLEEGDLELMIRLGLVRELREGEEVLGTVKLSWVAERNKVRRRPIRWTKAVNTALGRDSLQKITIADRETQLNDALQGRYALCLDMMAYYDQVPLPLLRHARTPLLCHPPPHGSTPGG